jgi:anthranilate phosphoribosyltransferase
MDIRFALSCLAQGRSLSHEDMTRAMEAIMGGEVAPAQIAGFLMGLSGKGETATELTAAAAVMRRLSLAVEVPSEGLVDTCGTGGDGAATFNISTTAAFVVAAAGGRVAKHGNRSVSSRSGSADVLEAAGVNLDLGPAEVGRCIQSLGIGFLYAPRHHLAMRHVGAVRRELGVRTLFNLLGPLANPAGAKRQLLGVYGLEWVPRIATVLQNLGSEHAMVVHGEDGLDEISIAAPTAIAELRDGAIRSYRLAPEDLGLPRAEPGTLVCHTPGESLALMRAVLDDVPGPARDVVLLNAGAALYVAGVAHDLAAGVARAREALASGRARDKLAELVAMTQGLAAAQGRGATPR